MLLYVLNTNFQEEEEERNEFQVALQIIRSQTDSQSDSVSTDAPLKLNFGRKESNCHHLNQMIIFQHELWRKQQSQLCPLLSADVRC
jgi:hypothetical protein